jgi:uncharacterized protein (TIGR00156 family)
MKRVSLLALLVVAPTAFSQYVGPGALPSANSVKAVLENPIDDQYVVLRGTLTRQLTSEQYEFSDGSGDIRVEIDEEDFPAATVNPTTTVEIAGEVEKDFLQAIEIDVDRMTIIDAVAKPGNG